MDTITLRDDALTWRAVDEEVVLLDLRTASYFSVNGSGSVLWPLLAEGSTRAGLVEELVRRYGLDLDRADSDVGRFLDVLDSHGLLDRDPAPRGQ